MSKDFTVFKEGDFTEVINELERRMKNKRKKTDVIGERTEEDYNELFPSIEDDSPCACQNVSPGDYIKTTSDFRCISCGRDLKKAGYKDQVVRPAHYTQYTAVEPFTFFMLNNVPFAEASVCKYVLRWRKKNGIEDLRKAARIIEMMIELETNKADYLPKKGTL